MQSTVKEWVGEELCSIPRGQSIFESYLEILCMEDFISLRSLIQSLIYDTYLFDIYF
jgi:hypothetical protein